MEEGEHVRRWEDLNLDILLKIFQSFEIIELLTSGTARVCRQWRWACCERMLRTLNLSDLKSNYIKIPVAPYVYVDDRSDKTLTRILKVALSVSRGNISTLIFHHNLYISDDQLTYIAERCPGLKRLVMPAWNRIKQTGISQAIRSWEDLESLTMPSIANPPYLLEEISYNCKKFAELKIMGPCHIKFASALVAYLPKLKVLSLRCSVLYKETLITILDGLKGLEVLNLSHCVIVELPPPAPIKILKELGNSILEKASGLRQLLRCIDDKCIMCQRTREDDGLLRWYKYEEGLWKVDEVRSLAV